jgi:hypothetical protein
MPSREFKIKILDAYRFGILSKQESKQLLRGGFNIPPTAWIDHQSEYINLIAKVFINSIPVFTWK